LYIAQRRQRSHPTVWYVSEEWRLYVSPVFSFNFSHKISIY
jgi:hypothetical protein